MHVHINGAIYNMDRFDSCEPKEAGGDYPHRVVFYRDGDIAEYAPLDSKEELERKWRQIVKKVDGQYL